MSPADSLQLTVVIVNTDDNTYHSHHAFGSILQCFAFAEGMMAAWKISHGYANRWHPFVLGSDCEREEWEEMGSPGRERMVDV